MLDRKLLGIYLNDHLAGSTVGLELSRRAREANKGNEYGDVLEREDGRVKLRVPKADTARITARLLAERDIADLTVEDPPIEDVIELVFAQERPE